MQDILHELIDIDADAQKLTDDAQLRRRNAGNVIAASVAALKDQYKKHAERSCGEFEREHRQSAEKVIAALRKKNLSAIGTLEAEYDKHGREWADDIFRAVIKEL